MRSVPSPKLIAIYTSMAVAFLSTAILFLLCFCFKTIISKLQFAIFTFSTFIISFLLFRYILIKFIQNKIKIIYKTIGKPLKFNEVIKNKNSNTLQTVERDVAEWAINKNKQIRDLRRTENYRKEFVGNVSHELKTPIFNAQGYIETLLDDDLDDKKFIKQYLEKAASNIDRLEQIVADLLEVSKFETGRIELDKTRFDVVQLIKKVFYLYQQFADEQQIKLIINTKEHEIFVFADEKRILQVLENLISNSIKYGKIGGTTQINIYDLEEQFLIEISDDGLGISEENVQRIFERFFRADKSRTRKMGGTGLGLSIVKNIIEAHEQTINVNSQIDTGTTFSFTLQK